MEIDLAWLAGFFDGEGSIGIYTNGQKHGRTLRVQITQNCSPVVDKVLAAVRDRWGGSLSVMNRGERRQAWNYQVSGAKGVVLLRDLRPHLVLKAPQADLALVWWDARPAPWRDPVTGRVLPTPERQRKIDEEAALMLQAMKVGVI